MGITLTIDDPGLKKLLQRGERKSNDFMDAVAVALTTEWRAMMQATPRKEGLSGASKPGYPPAIQTGFLINSIGNFRKKGLERHFYGPEYALFLNDSAQLNRPFIEPGMANVQARQVEPLAKEHLRE